ncbi:hypothetical protein [Pseudomonas sp. NPDC089406]|uniref:hypothetical protein n=1 Tax=Pseudomonas sp. NPDC089406 TaxID=3364463 RepID=UPI00384E36DA
MINTTYPYGTLVVEFFKHDPDALKALIDQRTVQYFRHSESPAYPQLGAHVDFFSDKPLTPALNELLEWTSKGYGVAAAVHQPLYLKVQLRKPQDLIDSDLAILTAEVEAAYAESRYARNIAEHVRQVDITLARETREREAAAAKALAEQLEAARQRANADLIAAYAKPVKPKAKADPIAEEIAA